MWSQRNTIDWAASASAAAILAYEPDSSFGPVVVSK
jgi:hypothetical protein